MASARREKGKKTWVLVWDEPRDPLTGKRRQKTKRGFRTKTAALEWFARRQEQEARRAAGTHATEMTVEAYLADWLRGHQARAGTLYNYERVHRVDINPYLGAIPLAELSADHIRDWHQQLLARPLAPSTIRGIHVILSSALNHAVRTGELDRNPAKLVRPPRVERTARTVWNEEQIRAFLAQADADKLGLLYRVMLFSQIRPGEALGMQWGDIDWRRGTVLVGRTRTRNRQGRHVVGREPKTRTSGRSIPLSADLLERLRQHRAQQRERRELAAELWQDHDLVFCRDDGRMLADEMVRYRLTRLAKLAGVPRLTPHELRHSGATLLLDMGEDLVVISRRLGHKSVATTADIYLSVTEERQRAVSDRIDQILRADVPLDDRVIDDSWTRDDGT